MKNYLYGLKWFGLILLGLWTQPDAAASLAGSDYQDAKILAKQLSDSGAHSDLVQGLRNPNVDVQGLVLKLLAKTSDKSIVPQLLDYLDSVKEGVEGSEMATINWILKKDALAAIRSNSGVFIPETNVRSIVEIERVIRQVAKELGLPEPKLRPQVLPLSLQKEKPQNAPVETAQPPGKDVSISKAPEPALAIQPGPERQAPAWLWAGGVAVAIVSVLVLLLRGRRSEKGS
jgi:hypothetical protein